MASGSSMLHRLVSGAGRFLFFHAANQSGILEIFFVFLPRLDGFFFTPKNFRNRLSKVTAVCWGDASAVPRQPAK